MTLPPSTTRLAAVRPARSPEPASGAPDVPGLSEIGRNWGLSPRQCDVMAGLVAGWTNKEIAVALVLSPYTVAQHVAEILRRTRCENRTCVATRFWMAARESSSSTEVTPAVARHPSSE